MRIVLKFGSGILASRSGSTLDEAQFSRLSAEVAGLVSAGHECILVSSGAVAAGLRSLGLRERPEDLSARQACAAVGQSKLMALYAAEFGKHGLTVGQLLLTHGDLDSRSRHANVRATLTRLLECGSVVPIINENDSVATEELRFGDNDRLSAEVAVLAGADALVLLTSVEGLLDPKGRLSVGGMVSKLQAVKLAVDAGITTWIASGRRKGQIPAIAIGRAVGTRFPGRRAGEM